MENKDEYQAGLFANRLRKRYRDLRKWARKNRITCFRLYDRDIPEIPLSLDIYEFLPDTVTDTTECARWMAARNAMIAANDPSAEKELKPLTRAVLCLYERPYEKDAGEETRWLDLMAETAAEILGITAGRIIRKERRHQKGTSQYEKSRGNSGCCGLVQEQGQIFSVDLSGYLDTGLFFDHRPLRARLRDEAAGKSVLNLFCYTGSFSVYAAQGNAAAVESVDLSNTYLARAQENMRLNGFSDIRKYVFTRADTVSFLSDRIKSADRFHDIIILDPPTFSNSKMTRTILDINRDWPALTRSCLNILNPGGKLYFSTNSARLQFDAELVPRVTDRGLAVQITDITEQTIPRDFEGTRCHRCWEFRTGRR